MANIFFLRPLGLPENFTKSYELHATTDIDVTFKTSFSKQPTQSSKTQSDNIVVDPIVIKFTGVLTDVAQGGGLISTIQNRAFDTDGTDVLSIGEYIEELRGLQIDKTLFDVTFAGDATTGQRAGVFGRPTANNGLAPVQKAIITSLQIHKDASLGKSWKVNLTLQQENALASTGVVCKDPNLCTKEELAAAAKKADKKERNIIIGHDKAYDIGARTEISLKEALEAQC